MAHTTSKTSASAPVYVALTGNPNCGKTTVFNALTGLRAKIGNYAGVTVERKEGRLRGLPPGRDIILLDLPGTYSLSPKSQDERIARDVLLHRLPDVPAPRVIVVVVDASNLQRHLYYTTQVIELGRPVIVALNMMDVAEQNGMQVNAQALAAELGVPVVPMVASAGKGVPELRARIMEAVYHDSLPRPAGPLVELPAQVKEALAPLAEAACRLPEWDGAVAPETAALLWLCDDDSREAGAAAPAAIQPLLRQTRQKLEDAWPDWRGRLIELRYARVAELAGQAVRQAETPRETFSDRLDRIVTHRVWGLVIFFGLMALLFQSIFVFARVPMDWIAGLFDAAGAWVQGLMPPGPLNELLVQGVIGGVGAVVVFLPQILFLFLFICLLEDTGYMARAAFIMDSLMSKVGLHGKSFIPMLSSFACAIPGIMATRTIESPKDRLVTILIAPLMSCSARLPVYTVLIGACIPEKRLAGLFNLQGLALMGAYLLGVISALAMAWIFKKTLLQATTPLLILELPPYKRPVFTVVLRHMWDRSKLFLTQAGTIILSINILLWFLATYPKNADVENRLAQQQRAVMTNALPHLAGAPAAQAEREWQQWLQTPSPEKEPWLAQLHALEAEAQAARLHHSFAGRLGRAIEPVIAPLGFDWKIGIGILASFAAREVFVSTMSVVYNVGGAADDAAATASLAKVMQQQKRPDGTPMYTTLTGITLMVFYVYALQCASTVAIVRRETNSWKWPAFQWLYLGLLAWTVSFLVYQTGRWLGWG
ncbi:ferrous iron transport protein B [Fontisphaera persica]|uniref:ferrous iron transport protein B n=1 Tax=Fontisphaera persica TaxID=2974023 RepID=UPI0024BF39C3|nr:ferrous iron transport protein B [Fontisphaera persica]WCJ59271.1 ferrous iron transport protein B [Fontisphaera persica]